MKKIKEFIRKNERLIKTFFEGLCSYLALNIMTTDFSSKTAVEGLIVGAIASAMSVLINKFDRTNFPLQDTFSEKDIESLEEE